MAVVYLGRDMRHYRDVAIKLFRVENEEPGEGSQRFLQEIQIASGLAHPNILPLHDSGEADGYLYYVMPYVPGETLRRRLEREGALPVADALRIAVDVADALAYAHSHGVIHRDIKPENILFISDHAMVADFGIARAISAGALEEWKVVGPVGTPAYMSPEQARNESRVDGRSDVYSLGCVLYEMLTGEPPFRGSTPEEVVVQHLENEPTPVQVRRPALPQRVQEVVGKSLAKHPADRYQTAQQMADALTRLATETGGAAPRASLRRTMQEVVGPRDSWLRRWAPPGIAALGIAAAVLWTTALRRPSLDQSLYLVAPLVHQEGVPEGLSGDQCRRLLHESLGRWDGVHLTDRRWVDDRLSGKSQKVTLEQMLQIARLGGAGRLIAGEVTPWGDSVRVRGVLYDVSQGPAVLREQTVTVSSKDLNDIEVKFAELADSLVLPRPSVPIAASGMFGTRILAALNAYDSAHASLASWELSLATRQFRTALEYDPNFGLAHLWLAQTLNWQSTDNASADEWRDEALAGIHAQPPLQGQEALWGQALVALGEKRFEDACKAYSAMLARDTLDFRAWFGRAECRSRDRMVVKDRKSPSGWAFRSGYQSAIQDYHRALTLVPSVHRAFRGAAFQRLSALFYAEPNMFRVGYAVAPDTGRFVAFPSLDHDTLAFIPYRYVRLTQGPNPWADGKAAAVARNQEQLRGVTAMWVRSFPGSPDAWEARGYVLEITGDLEGSTDSNAAVGAYRHALGLASTRTDSLRLRTTLAQLALKLGRFEEAARRADSLLDANPSPTSEEADQIAGLAALTGRVARLVDLMRRASALPLPQITDEYPQGAHPRLRAALAEFAAYASMGGPAENARSALRVVDDQIRAYVPATDRPAFREQALAFSVMLLSPSPVADQVVASQPPRFGLQRYQWYRKRGDTLSLRAALDSSALTRRNRKPSSIAIEGVYQMSVLHLAVRDTAAAVRMLDESLEAMPGMGRDLLNRPAAAGALVRAMVLRSQVASRLGDTPTARRWAVAATTLWAHADPAFQPTVDSLRRIIGGN